MNSDPDNDNDIDNPLKVIQPGETIVCEIKRHPIGLFGIYVTAVFIVTLMAIFAIFAPHVVTNMSPQVKLLLLLAFAIIAAGAFVVVYIATTIYHNNRWIVTSDSITQISQAGLFKKQVSQLSLANLEDVTVVQNSMLQSLLHFGTLHAETAGERSKFLFNYCPHPNNCARQILAARENFIRTKPDEAKRANDLLNVPPASLPQD